MRQTVLQKQQLLAAPQPTRPHHLKLVHVLLKAHLIQCKAVLSSCAYIHLFTGARASGRTGQEEQEEEEGGDVWRRRRSLQASGGVSQNQDGSRAREAESGTAPETDTGGTHVLWVFISMHEPNPTVLSAKCSLACLQICGLNGEGF